MAANWSRIVSGELTRPVAWTPALFALAAALVLFTLAPTFVSAQDHHGSSQDGGSWSGYQRKGHSAQPWDNKSKHDQKRDDWKHNRFRNVGPEISSGTFQRPYPYHMDYYKMKYGGSYAPYFGNIYGPPTFVGLPFYGAGTFNPWLGFEGGFNGYPPGGVGYPMGWGPEGYMGPPAGSMQSPTGTEGPVGSSSIAPGEVMEQTKVSGSE
jgi:hypothetical protein